MADSIVRLKVDSSEYDANLKKATQGLQHLETQLRKEGKAFSDVNSDTLKYIQGIGRMETQAKTARGRIGEMSQAFVEMSRIEMQLTDQEKASPVGQALSQSLQQLRQRTIEAKQELKELNEQIGETKTPSLAPSGGILSGIGDKMGGALQVFAGNMMTKAFDMATGAALTFVDSIKNAAAQGIEMAKAGEGIRIAFDRLNRPDLLDKLREATHGTVTDLELMEQAVKFNDFKLNLDEMGSMLAFAQQKAKDTGDSIDNMVTSIVTGLGRQSLPILDNLGLSATEIKDRMAETGDMTKAVASIIKEQMQNAGDYTETAADRAAKAEVELQNAMEALGQTLLPLEEQGTSMWQALELGAINALNKGVKPLVPIIIDLKDNIADLYDTVSNSSVFSGLVNWMEAGISTASRFIPLLNMLRQLMQGNEAGEGAVIGASIGSAVIDQTTSNIPEVVVNGTNRKGKAKSSEILPAGSVGALAKEMQTLQKEQQKVTSFTGWQDYQKRIDDIANRIKTIKEGRPVELPSADVYGISNGTPSFAADASMQFSDVVLSIKTPLDVLKEELEHITQFRDQAMTGEDYRQRDLFVKAKEQEIDDYTGKNNKEEDPTYKQMQKLGGQIGKFAGGLSNIAGGLEALGISLPQEVNTVINAISGVGQIITGVSAIVELFSVPAETANTAALIANSATMASLEIAMWAVAATNAIPFFANGGVVHAATGIRVPGNNYSGDNVPAMLNSGEVVLNQAQQGNLLSQMQGAGLQNLRLETVIEGRNLKIVLNNDSQSRGRGKYVTSTSHFG